MQTEQLFIFYQNFMYSLPYVTSESRFQHQEEVPIAPFLSDPTCILKVSTLATCNTCETSQDLLLFFITLRSSEGSESPD